MPIYSYECECGESYEKIYPVSGIKQSVKCLCGKMARKIITCSGHFTANQDAAWIRSVREVVDKNPNKPHCQEFLKNPTRDNYHNWIKKEGLRPLDKSEPYKEPQRPSLSEMKAATMKRFMERNSITLSR